MCRTTKYSEPQHPVFVASNGRPINEHNSMRRRVRPVGESLEMPWLSWHVFRRSHTTLADQLGASLADRMAMIGHDDMRMTMLYTVSDQERRRDLLESIGRRLLGGGKVN
jgi:integrase